MSNLNRIGLTFLIAASLLVFFSWKPSTSAVRKKAEAPIRPNIILINLDDADYEMFQSKSAAKQFPNLMKSISRHGIAFDNFHVTTPLCGPSRVCLYRGQYAHNTGICVNNPHVADGHHFGGGFQYYREHGYFEDDLSVWMKRAGYRTMMVGKFLHHDFETYVPPGWDDFYCSLSNEYYGTEQFTNHATTTDNRIGGFGKLPLAVYRTNAESSQAIDLITRQASRDKTQPFFLNMNPFGPHMGNENDPAMFDLRFKDTWKNVRQPYSPAFDEWDFSDKRGPFRDFERLPGWLNELTQTHYRERLLATKSVDHLIGELLKTLKKLNLDRNTYIFVTSDNGFSLGHNRMFGKGTPTERSTHVPLFVIGPDLPARTTAHHLLGHIDLAPTIVELGGGHVPNFVDGKSFAKLLKDPTSVRVDDWRQQLLIENWESLFAQRAPVDWASKTLRLVDGVYTEWANGDRDYYDLIEDPEQVSNQYDELSREERLMLELSLRTMTNPDLPAQARFTVPFRTNQLIENSSLLHGYAEDSFGVANVRLAFKDLSTSQYWNGENWQDDFLMLNATLENPRGLISRWNFELSIPEKQLPQGTCTAFVWGYDFKGRHAPANFATFRFKQK